MKRLNRILLAGICALTVSAGALARGAVPLANHENVEVVTGSGRPLDVEAVKKAITTAATAQEWKVAPGADGKSLEASLTWNKKKHGITVIITPTATHYSVRYADSYNMKHAIENGQMVIHPMYNQNVNELMQSIRAALLAL